MSGGARRRALGALAIVVAAAGPLAAGCASAGLEHTLAGHRGAVTSVAFSPRGDEVATGGRDALVRVFSVEDGATVHTLEGHRAGIVAVGYSPRGNVLASLAGDGTLRLWSAFNGALERKIDAQPGWVLESLAFAPNAPQVAARVSRDRIALWNETDGVLAAGLVAEQGAKGEGSPAIAFSPDGLRYVVCDGSRVELRFVQTGSIDRTLDARAGPPRDPAFSPAGDLLAVGGDDGRVRVWSVARGEIQHEIEVGGGAVNALAWSPLGGRLAIGSADGKLRIFDVEGGPARHVFAHARAVLDVAYAPAGDRVASAGDDEVAKVWFLPPE